MPFRWGRGLGRLLGAAIVLTVAAAEAKSGVDNQLIFVVETRTFYQYEADGGAYTDDDTFVLSTKNGGNTRWLGVAGRYIYDTLNILQSVTVGNSVAGDSLIRIYSGNDLKYHIGWDESAQTLIISESTADGTSDILRLSLTEIIFNAPQMNRDFIIRTVGDAEAFYIDAVNNTLTVGGNLAIGKYNVVGGTYLGGELSSAPDAITSASEGVAASLSTINTEVTTNGDSDLDNVTLANGLSGQIKHIYCVAVGNVNDDLKITPANMVGGTQITFGVNPIGKGCTLVYANNEGWVVVANNGGVIA